MDPEEVGTGGQVDYGSLQDMLHDYVWTGEDD